MSEINLIFLEKLTMTDESHFWLYGSVNKQNMKIWATRNQETGRDLYRTEQSSVQRRKRMFVICKYKIL